MCTVVVVVVPFEVVVVALVLKVVVATDVAAVVDPVQSQPAGYTLVSID